MNTLRRRTSKPAPGTHRVWLLGPVGPLDEPKGHFRNREEALRYARGRECWIVWEPALDGLGEVKWTYKEPMGSK